MHNSNKYAVLDNLFFPIYLGYYCLLYAPTTSFKFKFRCTSCPLAQKPIEENKSPHSVFSLRITILHINMT